MTVGIVIGDSLNRCEASCFASSWKSGRIEAPRSSHYLFETDGGLYLVVGRPGTGSTTDGSATNSRHLEGEARTTLAMAMAGHGTMLVVANSQTINSPDLPSVPPSPSPLDVRQTR